MPGTANRSPWRAQTLFRFKGSCLFSIDLDFVFIPPLWHGNILDKSIPHSSSSRRKWGWRWMLLYLLDRCGGPR